MRLRTPPSLACLSLLGLLIACSDDTPRDPDAGTATIDATATDATTPKDLGADAGLPEPDAGADAGAATPVCGNAQVESGEECDDGNQVEDDECTRLCASTATFRSYNQVIQAMLDEWSVPGAVVAVTRNERLVHLAAFGFADPERTRPMTTNLRFRIASVSKPITAVAIMKLVQDGVLSLDEPAFARLSALEPPEGSTPDPRLSDITIRHLLEHAGGWDSGQSGDPMFQPTAIAAAMGVASPPEAETIVAYMKGQPLDFDPGTRFVYSNFGYAVLGRIIETVTSTSYEAYVRANVLAPMGIEGMEIGRTRPELRPSDEVSYESHVMTPSVFADVEGLVPVADGGWYNEALDSHGGWIASAADLVRFIAGVDGRPGRPDLLSAASIETMTARPTVPDWAGQPAWYALGWLVRSDGGDANWWHGGSLPGTTTLIVRTGAGLSWSVLLNSRPANSADFGAISADVDQAMWTAAGMVTEWPAHDLFERLP